MTAKLHDVAGKTFDYVIIGGGTAGLTLASLLSSDPNVTIAVLEAGESHIGDPKVAVAGNCSVSFGPKYDWEFTSIPQPRIGNRIMQHHRGKGLGGSSAINWQFWTMPHKTDLDLLERLGNPGWNFKEFAKYFKRVEKFHPASDDQLKEYPYTYEPEHRGNSGPVQVTVPRHWVEVDALFIDTLEAMGLPKASGQYGGNNMGTRITDTTVDPKTWERSYAVTTYYLPVRERKNLVVLCEAFVSRMVFSDSKDEGLVVATGVEFSYGGSNYTVGCKKEVIVSCGTLKSPHVLELSGIGRPEILNKIGVDVKVNLPGVGENVQEHNMMATTWELDSTKVRGDTPLVIFDPFSVDKAVENARNEISKGRKGMPNKALAAFAYFPLTFALPESAEEIINSVRQEINELKQSGTLPPGRAEQYDIQFEVLCDSNIPNCQLISSPGRMVPAEDHTPDQKWLSMVIALNHQFSRGSVHARTDNPMDQPDINPNYHELKADHLIVAHHVGVTKKMLEYEPMKSFVINEAMPGPEISTPEQMKDFVHEMIATGWLGVGSCSMLPLEKQGVVSPELKVYGTKNVRVVDLSIIPLHVGSHTQALAYIIAEKAADIIRGL